MDVQAKTYRSRDAFEVAALAALDALHEVAHASYHSSQKRAVLEAIRAKIDEYLSSWWVSGYLCKKQTNEGDERESFTRALRALMAQEPRGWR